MRQAVITGVGAVCGLGNDAPSFWRRLIAGESGIRPITRFSTQGFRNRLGGVVDDEPSPDWDKCLPDSSRALRYGFLAAREAMYDAGLAGAEVDGLIVGTGAGETELLGPLPEPGRYPHWQSVDVLAQALSLSGFSYVFSQVCVSGAVTIGYAMELIRLGMADCVLAGGYEGLSPFIYLPLSVVRVITPEMIRPYDARRSGTIQAEGAAMVMVEEAEHARRRGHRAIAVLEGFAMNTNAKHMANPSCDSMSDALLRSLADAGLRPEAVGYINGHGTGTQQGDAAEAAAIGRVFGERARTLPVSSIKGAVGHLIGAAGAIEAVATALALQDQILPPTINYAVPDPNCPIDPVPNQARHATLRHAVSLSAGLGGNSAALVMGRGWEA